MLPHKSKQVNDLKCSQCPFIRNTSQSSWGKCMTVRLKDLIKTTEPDLTLYIPLNFMIYSQQIRILKYFNVLHKFSSGSYHLVCMQSPSQCRWGFAVLYTCPEIRGLPMTPWNNLWAACSTNRLRILHGLGQSTQILISLKQLISLHGSCFVHADFYEAIKSQQTHCCRMSGVGPVKLKRPTKMWVTWKI